MNNTKEKVNRVKPPKIRKNIRVFWRNFFNGLKTMNNTKEKEIQKEPPETSKNRKARASGLINLKILFGISGLLFALIPIIWGIFCWHEGINSKLDKMDQRYTKLNLNHQKLKCDFKILVLREKKEINTQKLHNIKEKDNLSKIEEERKNDLEDEIEEFKNDLEKTKDKRDEIIEQLNAGLSNLDYPGKTDKPFKDYYARLDGNHFLKTGWHPAPLARSGCFLLSMVGLKSLFFSHAFLEY